MYECLFSIYIYLTLKKPSVRFVGYRKRVQPKVRRLIMVSVVCFESDLLKLNKNKTIPPNNPANGNGLVQLIWVGHSIQLKWVKRTVLCWHKTQLNARADLVTRTIELPMMRWFKQTVANRINLRLDARKLAIAACEQQRCRPTCTFAQSGQRLCNSLSEKKRCQTCSM